MSINAARAKTPASQEPLSPLERRKLGRDSFDTHHKKRVARDHEPAIDESCEHPCQLKALHVLES